MLKRTCNPAVEISGQTLTAYVNNAMAYLIVPIFKKYGFENIDPEKWYPIQPLLDVLYEIGSQHNGSESLVAIGVKIAEYGVEAAETNKASLPVVLENWEKHLYANVRNGDVGHITTEKVNNSFYKVSHQNIFPDDLCYGLAFGFARSRLPLGTNFRVSYEDFEKRIDKGTSDKTVICVSWEARN
jgi:hypothetical protein